MRRYLKRGCAAFLAFTMILGLLPNMSVQAAEESGKAAKEATAASDFDAYRAPSLSGPTRTWVYQGEEFDYENSKNQIFADDQEDGDLTKRIIQKGFVDTSELGDQIVTYEVTDSDGHKSTLETTVTVLAKDETNETKKYMRRILYTIPDATHLTQIGFNRGYNHDRQNLGFWVPAGETLTVRLVNHDEFPDDFKLNVQLLNNDSWSENLVTVADNGEEGTYDDGVRAVALPKDGSWITVKNKCKVWETVPDPSDPNKTIHQKKDEFHYVDSVPFIYTPHNTTVRPIIEIKWNDAFQSIPYYRYGDDEESFFNDWDAKKSPYAIIEGQAATFLVPIKDRNNIIDQQGADSAYSFHTIDGMLEWYAGFVTQYDAYTGLDFYTDDPACQNVRAKFFIKANQNGAGLAYYGGDHSANNDDNLGGYLSKGWVSLHEFGHGYEGQIASQEYAFVESTNNIMAFYYEMTYRPKTDFGWLLGGAHGDEAARVEEYRKLGQQSEELRNSVSGFDESAEGKSGPVIDHRNRLFMFTNALDALGPEKTTAAMHTQFRKYVYDSGNTKRPSSGNVIVDSFSHAGGYNMAPYFDGWHIVPTDEVKEAIYDEDLPMLYYIRNLIPDDTEAEKVRKELSAARTAAGKDALNGIYSLVSTDDIASLSTKYTSKVKLSVSIDDAAAIAGKKILIKNGEKIVASVPMEADKTEYDIELPAGIYEVELPTPRKAGYEYDKEYLVAAATNIGTAAGTSVEKELSYTKISGDPLVEDIAFYLKGFGQHVVDFDLNTGEGKLTCRINSGMPHSGRGEDRYIQFTVQDPQEAEVLDRTLKANTKYDLENNVVDFPIGSKLIIYHHEEDKLYFDSKYTKKDLRSLYFKVDANKTYTYVMTEYGLMPEGFSEDQMQETYLSLLCSYSDYLIENVMTESDIANEGRLNNLKQPIRIAYEKLNDAAKEEYDRLYGRLLGHESTLYGYDKIPSSLLKGTADSHQGGEVPANAVDGQSNTAWHTQWYFNCISNNKNTYTITLSEPRDVARLEYEPHDGDNGRILTYKLEYSTTESGDDFQPVKAFRLPAWADNENKKSVDFEAPGARRIRITGLTTAGEKDESGNGKYMAAKDFWLYEKHEKKLATSYLSDLEFGMGENAQADKESKTVTLSGSQGIIADLIGKEFDNLSAKVSLANADAGTCFKIYNGEGENAKLLYQFEKTAHDLEETFSVDVAGIRKLRFEISDDGQAVLSNAKFGNQEHKKNIYMVKGDVAAVSANMSLSSSVTGLTTWTSGDEQIATVDENGNITAVAAGNTTIREQIGTAEPLVCNVYVCDTLDAIDTAIEEVKSDKKAELEAHTNEGDYSEAGKAERTKIITDGRNAINAAMNISGISAALSAAINALDAIATSKKELAEELKQKKAEAKKELENYKNSDDYRKAQRQELKRAIAEGWLAIDQQNSIDGVETALAEGKGKLELIQTNYQMSKAELEQTVSNVQERIKTLTKDDFDSVAWQRLEEKLSAAQAVIGHIATASISEMQTARKELIAAENALLKPQAVKAAEKELQDLIDEYADSLIEADYRTASWKDYQTALKNAKTYLPGGENEQFEDAAPILAAKDALIAVKEAMEQAMLVLEGDWIKGLRASESSMVVVDGKLNLTGIGDNNHPATFISTETFDFSKAGSFEFDLENYNGARFGVYLDYSEDNDFACGMCMFTQGDWTWQNYTSKDGTNNYGGSGVKVPQSPDQKQHIKVEWTAEGKCSLYIDGEKALDGEKTGGLKNETIQQNPQGKIAFMRLAGSQVTISDIRPLKRMVVTPSETKAVTAKIPVKLNTQYRGVADQGIKATWSSSNEEVAYADRMGNVYFVGMGEAEITAEATLADNSTYTAEKVKVNLPSAIDTKKAIDGVNAELIKGAWANTNASSGNDGPASYAIDGNSNTVWHSQYNGFTVSEENPAKLTIEFAYDLSVCDLIQFQQGLSNQNGYVKKYQIVVGDRYDEVSHEIVDCQVSGIQRTEGNIVANPGDGLITVTLPESNDDGGRLGRYLQIRVLEGNGGFARIREIAASFQKDIANDEAEQSYITANGQYVEVIKALEGKIQQAENADSEKYTPANWGVLQQTIKDATDAIESMASKEQLEKLNEDFEKALSNTLKYSVKFNWNYDEAKEELRYVEHGELAEPLTKKDAPKREGYYFTGEWYLEPECKEEFLFSNTKVKENKELYAQWKKLADKQALNAAIDEATEKLNGKYTPDSIERLSVQIRKAQQVADDETATQEAVDQETADLRKVINKLELIKHTVTFNWNYTDARQDTAEVLDGESADLPTLADAPARDQFEFTGKWYTESACENEFASNTEISGDLVLYAKWVELGLTQAKKELEGLLTQASKLAQADYSQAGWDTLQAAITKAQTAAAGETLASVVSAKAELTAAMANTAIAEARAALQKLYDDSKDYDKNLYTAVSWKTFETALKTAETALNNAEASLDDLNAAKAGLEAAKAALKTVVTVIFNWNYEGAEAKQQSVEQGGKLTAPTEVPNRTGYEFTGKWYKEPACQTEFNFNDETVSDEMTLYAGWTNSVKTPLEEAKESLRTKISEAENLKAEDYSKTGWQALQTALADARKLMDSTATLDQLNQAIQALTKAAAYTMAAEIAEAKAQLSDLYSEYTSAAYDESVYTPESWSAFQKALQNAKTIIDKADASLEEVNAALADIQAAEGDLSLKQEIKVDKTALQAQIASAEGLLSGHYTTVSLEALKAELAKAKEVAAKANATQTSVDQATARLKSAVESLVPLYTVTFNWNYEGAETQSQEVERGSHAAALIEAPARTGFEFTGLWYTDVECTKEYVFADETITKDLTLYAGWITVSEEEIAAAKEALNTLLAEAEKLQAADYSENGWQKVQAAKEAAKKAVSAGTLTGINQAKEALQTAMAYTKAVETAEKKEELTALYQQYTGDNYDEASYTTESWASFQAALLHAKEVLDQSDASLEAVTEAAANLQKAAEGLSLRQDIVIDKTKLMETIKKAEGLLSGKYTAESLKNLETKLAEAREAAAKDNATQKAVDNAEQSLKAAIESLVPLYTVTFDWNYEGGKTETQEAAKDGAVSAPTEIPAREGYTFTGKWYLEKECKTEFVVANETVQGDIILYAGWTVKSTDPSVPENPDDPYDPSVPENPDDPDQPSVPDKPNQPETPEQPETPPDDGDNYSIVTKIQFAQSKYEIVKGKSINLENEIVSMMPEDPDDEELVWSSSNPKVAAVDESSGIVKTNKSAAKKTAIITVRNADEEIVASVRVKVMNGNVSKIRPKGKKVLSVKAGKSIKLKAIVSVKGKKPFNKKLKWVSSNTEVATVSSKLGLTTQVKIAKGVKKGKSVKITAISTDGTNKKLVFKLKVK